LQSPSEGVEITSTAGMVTPAESACCHGTTVTRAAQTRTDQPSAVAAAAPSRAAATPAAREPQALPAAVRQRPASSSCTVSWLKVLNVVSAPQKPVANSGCAAPGSRADAAV